MNMETHTFPRLKFLFSLVSEIQSTEHILVEWFWSDSVGYFDGICY